MSHVFYFHYNKPASQRAGRPQISIHWRGRCTIVDNLTVDVPTKGRVNKRQPYFVMVGKGVVRFQLNTATISAE